jgi:hypothetical protein
MSDHDIDEITAAVEAYREQVSSRDELTDDTVSLRGQ